MNIDDIFQDILALPEPVQDQVRDFVGYLKVKYNSKSTSPEVDIVEETKQSPEAKSSSEAASLTDDDFWSMIDLLDYDRCEGKEVVAPLIKHLANEDDSIIFAFQDRVALKLSDLDGPSYFEASPGSSDSFLYARCCVVANGKDFYENVLNNPEEFPDDLHFVFEPLLYVADDAYELKHGKLLNRVPTYNYESFFNKKAWGEKTITL